MPRRTPSLLSIPVCMFVGLLLCTACSSTNLSAEHEDNDIAQAKTDTVYQSPQLVGGMQALYDELEVPEQMDRGELRTVKVQFVIREDSTFEMGEVLESSSVFEIDMHVVEALQRIEWIPGTINGEPAAAQMTLPVKFSRSW